MPQRPAFWRSLFPPPRIPQDELEAFHLTTPRQCWTDACDWHGWTPEFLVAERRKNAWLAWAFFIAGLVWVLLAEKNAEAGYWWGAGTDLTYGAVLFLWAAKASWKCWLIDTQKLHWFTVWARTPAAWFPTLGGGHE